MWRRGGGDDGDEAGDESPLCADDSLPPELLLLRDKLRRELLASVEALELELGGKTRTLQPQSHEPRSIGSGEPLFRPPSGYLSETWYEVKPSDLRAFAAAPPAMLRVLRDDGATDYAAWRRADVALKAFVEDIPDATPSSRPRR